MTTSWVDENGITHYRVSKDALQAASFLDDDDDDDDDDAPELTEEQFERLTDAMREVREESHKGQPESE